MGSTKKTISFDDYVFETYLKDFEGNFSKYIQKLVLVGHDAIEGKHEIYKRQSIDMANKIAGLQIENRNLKALVERLKKRSASSPESICQKYQFSENDFNNLKECQKIVKEKPDFLEGNYNRFKNDSAKDISLKEFRTLMDSDLNKITVSGDGVDD